MGAALRILGSIFLLVGAVLLGAVWLWIDSGLPEDK